MSFEDYLSEKLDANRWKEKLYQRAQEVIRDNKITAWWVSSLSEFQKHLRSAYLALLTDREIINDLKLPTEEVKYTKGKFNKQYQSKHLDHLRDESDEATDEYREESEKQEAMIENMQNRFKNFSYYNSYTRTEKFQNDQKRENIFEKKISQCNAESFLFNRLYEMMMTKMIQAYVEDDFSDYKVKVYKTTSYDDLMSWVDIIVALQNKEWYRANVGIDHICGNSISAIEGKENKSDKSHCMEYNSSVRNGRFSAIPRVVRNSNPWISFLLFDWYLWKIAAGEDVANSKLIDIYYEIQQSHPELYKESLDSGTEIDKSNDRVKNAILDLIDR